MLVALAAEVENGMRDPVRRRIQLAVSQAMLEAHLQRIASRSRTDIDGRASVPFRP